MSASAGPHIALVAADTIAVASLIVAAIAIISTRRQGRELQEQDHQHARLLQLQQQDHERQMSGYETRVQERIAGLTREMVGIERSRREDEVAASLAAQETAHTAHLVARIKPSYVNAGAIVIENRGPAEAMGGGCDHPRRAAA